MYKLLSTAYIPLHNSAPVKICSPIFWACHLLMTLWAITRSQQKASQKSELSTSTLQKSCFPVEYRSNNRVFKISYMILRRHPPPLKRIWRFSALLKKQSFLSHVGFSSTNLQIWQHCKKRKTLNIFLHLFSNCLPW